MQLVYVLLALVAGMLMPVQAGINSQLKNQVLSTEAAAFVSLAVGTLALGVYLALRRLPLPLAAAMGQTSWWMWTGGLLGAFFVAATVYLAYKLGAGTMMGLIIAGQLSAAILLDHYALLGFPPHPVSWQRLLGAALLAAGAILIRR
jgi:transporter family-2 protein